MNLREFLEQREKVLREQIVDLHRQLAPLEAEIAEVRRAKGALGITNARALLPGANQAQIGHQLTEEGRRHQQVSAAALAKIQITQKVYADVLTKALSRPLPIDELANPYASMTMKELVVKALTEHFPHGATTRQMLDFFRDAWGREIERTNLSPQISRLYQEGVIGRAAGRKEWYLMRNPKGTPAGYKPVVLRHSGEINWVPQELEREEWIPIQTQYPGTPDPDED